MSIFLFQNWLLADRNKCKQQREEKTRIKIVAGKGMYMKRKTIEDEIRSLGVTDEDQKSGRHNNGWERKGCYTTKN